MFRSYFPHLFLPPLGKLLCFLIITGAGISCKEKQKPPDYKQDTSSTVLFKREKPLWQVSAEKVVRSSFQRFITSTGVVVAGVSFPVNSPLTGRISHLPVEDADTVKQGRVIAEMDQTSILQQLQYQTSIVEYQKEYLKNLRKIKNHRPGKTRALEHLLQAEEMQQKILENRLEDTHIKSPVTGQIQRLFVQRDEIVSQGDPIALVVDLSQIVILADVHQEDLPYLKKGTRVEVRLSQNPRQVFLGEVSKVSLEANPQTHRFGLEVSVVNLGGKFLPGMAANLKVRGPFMKNVFSVPVSAVKRQQKEIYVFVGENSRARLRKVILGPESSGRWIVRSGVKEGDMVITSQTARLSDDDSVEIITGGTGIMPDLLHAPVGR